MVKIAIYDDSTVGSENSLSSQVSQFFLSRNIPHCITAFDSGIELLKILKTKPVFDVALIDMIVPEYLFSHLVFADDRNRCILIFSTFQGKFPLRENPLYAFDFFLHSSQPNIIYSSLENVLIHLTESMPLVPIKVKGIVHDYPAAKITYIESCKHYLYFHLENGTAVRTYAKLDDYENILSGYGNFLRCHQSFLVNLDYVKQVCGRDFIMESNIHVPIRKAGFSQYKNKYFSYTLVKDGSEKY